MTLHIGLRLTQSVNILYDKVASITLVLSYEILSLNAYHSPNDALNTVGYENSHRDSQRGC